MNKTVFTTLLSLVSVISFAQDKLFGPTEGARVHNGFILNGNVSGDLPMGDMAKSYGKDYRLGASVTYKTTKNWVFGVKYDFLLGNVIKADSFMINIKDKYSGDFNGKVVQTLNVSGQRVGVPVYERGFMVGVQAGKIIPIVKGAKDNGIYILTTAGFMQHRINIFNRDKDVPQIGASYLKGYDRMANGMFLEQYVGYIFFAKNKLINFNMGLDFAYGFTQGRRSYLYDLMRADDSKRSDILLGIRGAWMIPIFHRKSEEVSFDE